MTDEDCARVRECLVGQLREIDAVQRLGGIHPLVEELKKEHNFDISRMLSELIRRIETGDWEDQ